MKTLKDIFFEEREEELSEEQIVIQAEREEHMRWLSDMKRDDRQKRLFSPKNRWKNRKYVRKFDNQKLPF